MIQNGNNERQITEKDTTAIIVAGIVQFLQLFVPVTLAKRLPAILLLALGVPDARVAELVGVSDRTVRGLRKQVKACENPGDVADLLTIKKREKTRSKTQGVEEQILHELEKHNISTRKEAVAIIKDTFGIEISVWSAGRLLKKGASKGEKQDHCQQRPIE